MTESLTIDDVPNPWDTYAWDEDVRDISNGPPGVPVAWRESEFVPVGPGIAASAGDTWDGVVVGLVELVDGRWLSYETFYGPTGDGFNADAYGGDAIVFVGDEEAVVRWGMTDEGRSMLGIDSVVSS